MQEVEKKGTSLDVRNGRGTEHLGQEVSSPGSFPSDPVLKSRP
jgi:hypothetical protein